MSDFLSQKEIDELLAPLNAGEADVEGGKPARRGELRKVRWSGEPRLRIYDMKRPTYLPVAALKGLRALHESFARLAAGRLSAAMRTLVNIHVASLESMTFEDFIRSIPTPTTLAAFRMPPLRGMGMLEIDPTLSFTILDSLMGGSLSPVKLNRELTDLEHAMFRRLVPGLLKDLDEAWRCWSGAMTIRHSLGMIETNPQFLQIMSPATSVVLVSMEASVGEIEGMLNLCLPFPTIRPLLGTLAAGMIYSEEAGRGEVAVEGALNQCIGTLPIREIAEWRPDSPVRLSDLEAILDGGAAGRGGTLDLSHFRFDRTIHRL